MTDFIENVSKITMIVQKWATFYLINYNKFMIYDDFFLVQNFRLTQILDEIRLVL